MEEEDTTREVRRLESTLSMAMKHIKVSLHWQCLSVSSEIEVLHNLVAFAGHSMNYQTTATADQEDGAPHQGERKIEGGDEAY